MPSEHEISPVIGKAIDEAVRRTLHHSGPRAQSPWTCVLGFVLGITTGVACTVAVLPYVMLAAPAAPVTATVAAAQGLVSGGPQVQPGPAPPPAVSPAAPVAASAPVAVQGPEDSMAMVKRHAGLYKDKASHPEFANTVLVTAANSGYLDVLQNWECASERLGLDWVVLALDDETYKFTGPARSILVSGKQVSEAVLFGRPDFYVVTCNKLKIVVEIMKQANLNVVFSDCDNVFKHDPFGQQVSLGKMMRSGSYEYVYGRKTGRNGPKPEEIHQEPDKANTGFYYVAGSRKQPGVQSLYDAALERCNNGCRGRRGGDRPCDDQENFWDLLVETRHGQSKDPRAFKCFRHCDATGVCEGVPESETFNYCDMDPYEFPEGSYGKASTDTRVVAYHANWVFGKGGKIGKLRNVGLWHWNSKENKCNAP